MITFKRSLWQNEFEQYTFDFEGRTAIIVFPHDTNKTTKWIMKMEYFDAFQDMELQLVKRGFHLVYLQNVSRWVGADDLETKYRFRNFIVNQFSLKKKGVFIGFSCGGLHSIRQAAKYPDMVSCLYLDAPVVNLLSVPFGLGNHPPFDSSMKEELLNALHMNMSDVIKYREHPLDKIPTLIENRIPLLLVCGGSDSVVPYDENGYFLKLAYEESQIPFLFLYNSEREHHPHVPMDDQIENALQFIIQHC